MVHCTVCFKPVYQAEEIKALGRIWHKACFKCGTNTEFGCRRVLRAGEFLDNNNNPFCNTCYGKLFKPKGVGYGNALSTTETFLNTSQALSASLSDVAINDKEKSGNLQIRSASASASTAESKPAVVENPSLSLSDPPPVSPIPSQALFIDGVKPKRLGSAGLVAILQSQQQQQQQHQQSLGKSSVPNNQASQDEQDNDSSHITNPAGNLEQPAPVVPPPPPPITGTTLKSTGAVPDFPHVPQ
jgi:hypothetical protein